MAKEGTGAWFDPNLQQALGGFSPQQAIVFKHQIRAADATSAIAYRTSQGHQGVTLMGPDQKFIGDYELMKGSDGKLQFNGISGANVELKFEHTEPEEIAGELSQRKATLKVSENLTAEAAYGSVQNVSGSLSHDGSGSFTTESTKLFGAGAEVDLGLAQEFGGEGHFGFDGKVGVFGPSVEEKVTLLGPLMADVEDRHFLQQDVGGALAVISGSGVEGHLNTHEIGVKAAIPYGGGAKLFQHQNQIVTPERPQPEAEGAKALAGQPSDQSEKSSADPEDADAHDDTPLAASDGRNAELAEKDGDDADVAERSTDATAVMAPEDGREAAQPFSLSGDADDAGPIADTPEGVSPERASDPAQSSNSSDDDASAPSDAPSASVDSRNAELAEKDGDDADVAERSTDATAVMAPEDGREAAQPFSLSGHADDAGPIADTPEGVSPERASDPAQSSNSSDDDASAPSDAPSASVDSRNAELAEKDGDDADVAERSTDATAVMAPEDGREAAQPFSLSGHADDAGPIADTPEGVSPERASDPAQSSNSSDDDASAPSDAPSASVDSRNAELAEKDGDDADVAERSTDATAVMAPEDGREAAQPFSLSGDADDARPRADTPEEAAQNSTAVTAPLPEPTHASYSAAPSSAEVRGDAAGGPENDETSRYSQDLPKAPGNEGGPADTSYHSDYLEPLPDNNSEVTSDAITEFSHYSWNASAAEDAMASESSAAAASDNATKAYSQPASGSDFGGSDIGDPVYQWSVNGSTPRASEQMYSSPTSSDESSSHSQYSEAAPTAVPETGDSGDGGGDNGSDNSTD